MHQPSPAPEPVPSSGPTGTGPDELGLGPRVRPVRKPRLQRVPRGLGERASEWAAQTAWLASGVPPARIGWSRGPLTVGRQLRHRLRRRPLELCLLERHDRGPRFASAQAFWINQRSTVFRARVNSRPETADLVWVFSQDPLDAQAREVLPRDLARVRPGVHVINSLEVYDSYHAEDCFPRLAAAGVRVPRFDFGPEDVGRTDVVYKAVNEQTARNVRRPYRGHVPGYRAFEYVDTADEQGVSARYRAHYVGGELLTTDILFAPSWNVRGRTCTDITWDWELTAHECEQIALAATTLGLDFFAVDFLRRPGDGLPVLVDINVYPTVHLPPFMTQGCGVQGRWHFFEAPALLQGAAFDDQWTWKQAERGLLGLVESAGAAAASAGRPGR